MEHGRKPNIMQSNARAARATRRVSRAAEFIFQAAQVFRIFRFAGSCSDPVIDFYGFDLPGRTGNSCEIMRKHG